MVFRMTVQTQLVLQALLRAPAGSCTGWSWPTRPGCCPARPTRSWPGWRMRAGCPPDGRTSTPPPKSGPPAGITASPPPGPPRPVPLLPRRDAPPAPRCAASPTKAGEPDGPPVRLRLTGPVLPWDVVVAEVWMAARPCLPRAGQTWRAHAAGGAADAAADRAGMARGGVQHPVRGPGRRAPRYRPQLPGRRAAGHRGGLGRRADRPPVRPARADAGQPGHGRWRRGRCWPAWQRSSRHSPRPSRGCSKTSPGRGIWSSSGRTGCSTQPLAPHCSLSPPAACRCGW